MDCCAFLILPLDLWSIGEATTLLLNDSVTSPWQRFDQVVEHVTIIASRNLTGWCEKPAIAYHK
jgi:hypothetical protein